MKIEIIPNKDFTCTINLNGTYHGIYNVWDTEDVLFSFGINADDSLYFAHATCYDGKIISVKFSR